jgi:tyrosinase
VNAPRAASCEGRRRLQQVNPAVFLPYWDWIADPAPPAGLSKPSDLTSWSVIRTFDPSLMPTAPELTAVMNLTTFARFQRWLEGGPHGDVHNAIGGTMASASSPSDPIFWLHHANLDRLWSQWQGRHPNRKPPNDSETLLPAPMFNVKVADVGGIAGLGYSYS